MSMIWGREVRVRQRLSAAAATWAARSWQKRATEWLQREPHDLELDGKDVVYHPAGYENGFAVRARTLSQMDVRGIPHQKRDALIG